MEYYDNLEIIMEQKFIVVIHPLRKFIKWNKAEGN